MNIALAIAVALLLITVTLLRIWVIWRRQYPEPFETFDHDEKAETYIKQKGKWIPTNPTKRKGE